MICFNIDQDSAEFDLVPEYERYKCDYLTYEEGYVMWGYLRWHSLDSEPTISNIVDPSVEVVMSKAPFTQTLNTMDVNNFDINSRNYRLEAIIMFALFLLCVISALFLFMYNDSFFQKLTEEQEEELRELEQQDEASR